jgi:hypothetical protein
MLNPDHASKSPLSSRVALPIALLLAGIFGLGISLIQPTSFSKISRPAVTADAEQAPGPAEPDPGTAEPGDLVDFCSRHVTVDRSFVVFQRGTCVVINEPCKDPMAEARRILALCKDFEAPFLSEQTSDGEMIVAFKEPVFHRFSQTELKALEPWLQHSAAVLLTPDETVAAGDGWTPPLHAKVGLLARRRMLEDAASAVPVKVIRARDRAMASR